MSREALGGLTRSDTGFRREKGKREREVYTGLHCHTQGVEIRAGVQYGGLLSRSSALFGADWPARSASRMNSSRGMAGVLAVRPGVQVGDAAGRIGGPDAMRRSVALAHTAGGFAPRFARG